MLDFFQLDTDKERRLLLARARIVALTALQRYEIEWERIQFIQLSDTITYQIETSMQQRYLLRIHSERCSKEEICSELALLQALTQSEGLNVPEGVAGKDGSYVMEIDTEMGYRRPYVTLMRWVEGQHASEMTDNQIYRMGAMMGRLHESAARITLPPGFTRPEWGVDSFAGEMKKLERYYSRFLSEQAWSIYQAAAEKIMSHVSVMEKNEDNYGLIHGDLHSGNIIFNGEEPCPIDFGRCGYGYYLYDMAGALLELSPKQREYFIEGYESARKLPLDYVRDVECFFVMFMIENGCHHASNPEETNNLISEQPFALAYLRKFLQQSSFLFRRIEPVSMGYSAAAPLSKE
ncbi:phosphotransferase [Paenibacillus thiaminolyticus]|uniref:Phosphotransferase n=1 Tax=Paenibacillus thiaminolyticus TaxID=49283 RepID=A0AAP9DQG9_PANTH|nr:phosphotransferase [Paenibacillus thiaminolyticus]MCY9535827.1 phosphotransferase [Paenibacillus thiaminolyticus]MCY9600636.1 phosphotransferase [Paenibacillus thiaminolyticus]MCY9611164.1 phosphotransferase [Paenibacillus thiaminolyticus]MCY9614758.1 phosphotransferase [Paenibacillus thiaminolyticus]MCY9619950.1 phosphotransferase [Paenibacillus thiaminolyticus]